MASAVAKRGDQCSTRSASWPVMHSDEELARILQIQEEKEYQDHLTAKEVQVISQNLHNGSVTNGFMTNGSVTNGSVTDGSPINGSPINCSTTNSSPTDG